MDGIPPRLHVVVLLLEGDAITAYRPPAQGKRRLQKIARHSDDFYAARAGTRRIAAAFPREKKGGTGHPDTAAMTSRRARTRR
jgi:hypothetical protein